jgi:hypothetical protein
LGVHSWTVLSGRDSNSSRNYFKLEITRRYNVKHIGKIRWFDALSGEGFVRGSDGRSHFVHFTAIEGVKKHNYSWPHDDDRALLKSIDGVDCEFDLIEDVNWTQVSKLVLKGENQ